MLIINADDWGGWQEATNAALPAIRKGRITSVTAMVFTDDAERAATISRDLDIGVGLHLNLDSLPNALHANDAQQRRVVRFLRASKYAQLVYHPLLRRAFRDVFKRQWDEFVRLYHRPPTHVDGHHHLHLCLNMLLDGIIPRGTKVRRSFTFEASEKGVLNRLFRRAIDARLRRRHRITDGFFSLERCLQRVDLPRVARLANERPVELMTHPENAAEQQFLLGEEFCSVFSGIKLGSYSAL